MEASEKLIEFVRTHLKEDINALRLKYSGKKAVSLDFDLDFALIQIEARRKAKLKLPGFLSYPEFVFPTLLSSEQATNEIVARFHADLLLAESSILDITAGLGIDDMMFALKNKNVTACEIDQIKCEALRHNSEVLDISNKLTVINEDCTEYVNKISRRQSFDVVYADPARRDTSGARVHALSDCQPDIITSLPNLLSIAPRVLVKSSPLLDLSLIRNTVQHLSHIYVVCLKGECKEILIDINKKSSFEGVTVVDLDKSSEISRFHTEFKLSDGKSNVPYCDRKKASDYRYIYEPNAGVMKTGAWSSLVAMYPELTKADINTHIFFSDSHYSDFPGRIMQITTEPDKKALKALKGKKYNIVARNHPLSATDLARKYSVTSGGEEFIYALRYNKTPTILITQILK